MRRMLLTSNGIQNESIRSALADLVGRRFGAARAVYIPTASVAQAGDHSWLVEDLNQVHGLRWREFNVLVLNGLPAQMVLERLRHADVIYVAGGNHYHLANSIAVNGLGAELADLLETKVYVGMSAGSMIFSRNLSAATGEAFGEEEDLALLGGAPASSPAGLFDWYLKPHMNARGYNRTPAWFEKVAAMVGFPVYALDNDSAVRVRGNEVDVVSDGEWLLLNAPAQDAVQGSPQRDKPRRRLTLPLPLLPRGGPS